MSDNREKRIKNGDSKKLLSIIYYLFTFLIFTSYLLPVSVHAGIISKPANNLGLVGYWSFDGGAGSVATDFSGSGNDATLNNMEEEDWVNGKVGGALDFDGAGTESGSVPTISIPSDITVSAWVKVTLYDRNQFVMDKSTTNTQWALFFEANASGEATDGLKWRGGSAAGISYAASNFVDDVWYHVAGTQTGTDCKLYVNGEEVKSGTCAAIGNGSGTISIGSANPGYDYSGLIDDVRIYDRAISDAEIKNIYKAGAEALIENTSQKNSVDDGLVAYYTFDGADVSGTTITDVSGNGNDGTATGGPVPAIGVIGQAYEFDGSDNVVTLSDSPFDFDDEMTILAWINVPTNTKIFMFDKLQNYGSYDGYTFNTGYSNNHNKLSFFSPNFGWKISSGTYIPDEWQQVGVAIDGNSAVFYINGVSAGSFSGSGNLTTNNVSADIMRSYTNAYSTGKIDDVRVYNRTLSPQEIQTLYNMGN